MDFLLCLQESERAAKGIQEEEGYQKAHQIAGTGVQKTLCAVHVV